MKIYKAESAVRPAEWELDKSANHIYHNTDITEVPATEEAPAMFEYTVTEYSAREYMALQYDANEQLRADIDYISAMADIPL